MSGTAAAPGGDATGTANRATGATAAPADELRDIRGPVAIPPPWLLPASIVGAILLAGIVGWLLARWWRRRPVAAPAGPGPEEVALARLEDARRWMQPPRPREFGAAVSDAIRLYIEDRYAARAAHRTTEEFLHEIARAPASALAEQRSDLEDFLRHCDLAKFARDPLGAAEMESMHASALRFVTRTRPLPVVGATG